MKRKLILTVLFVFLFVSLVGSAFSVSAEDETVWGDHIFDADRMMYFDEGTRFEQGIVNGGIINPGTGAPSTYAGIKFDKTTYLEEECVKVELLDGYTAGFFDFNYYQHNSEVMKPVLDATSYPYLKIRYSYVDVDEDHYYMKFWAANQKELGNGGSTSQMYIGGIDPSEGEWHEAVVYVGNMGFDDGTMWTDNAIRHFRIHMFEGNSNPNAVCYIAGFGFFESKAKAEAYDFTLEDNFVDIIYNANGGFSAPEPDVKQIGGDATLSKGIPGRLGYKFIGWSTTDTGEVVYQPGDKYTVDEPIELYAQWEKTDSIEEGDRIFDADRMLKYDEGTHFRNGFVNGAVRSPLDGLYYLGQGVEFYKTTHNNEPAIRIELLDGYKSGYLGFNYYAYDEEEGYKPSLIGEKYPYLKVRYAYEGASSVDNMVLWASKATTVLGRRSTGQKSFKAQQGYGEWKEAVVDLRSLKFGDQTTWAENVIREFRLNLFLSNQNSGALCYIAGIGFFETEEEAQTYNFETGEYGSIIEYSANGGVCAPTSQLKEKDVAIKLSSAVPAKRGFKFVGWSTTIDGEVVYQPGDEYDLNGRVKLYAVWEKDTAGTVKMGEHIFEGDRLVKYDTGTHFENGFANGAEVSPVSGLRPTFTGVSLGMTTYKDEKAMKVELLDGYTTGILDFNYYQWNSEAYKPSLDAAKYPYLRIRFAYENAENVTSMTFGAYKDAPVLSTNIAGGEKSFRVTSSGEWTDVVVDVRSIKFGDNTYWDESTVRQFRIYPFEGNTNSNAVCYIAGFGFFETEEEANNYVFNAPTVYGDVNSDGKVDRKDLTRLAQYFARWNVEIDNAAADANGDGKVDRKDLTRLAQYFARWDVVLGK